MTEPIYRTIADDLERRIDSGELSPGSQLLTEQELQQEYGASRNTVREAVKWLISRGLVETRPGQGTFVLTKKVPFVTMLSTDPAVGSSEGAVYWEDTRETPEVSTTQVEIQAVPETVALELGLTADSDVVSRHQQRFIRGTPWSLQTSFYPMSLVDRGARRLLQTSNIDEGTVRYLEDTLGVKQAGYRDTIRVRAPDDSEASFFGVPADGRVSILAAVRTAFGEDGKAIRVTITVYPADRTLFEIHAGLVPDAPPTAGPAELTGGVAQCLTEHPQEVDERN
jgi:GntR family transcriptional regulator